MTPLTLGLNHGCKVALCDLYYVSHTSQFNNAKISVLDIYIPKYTRNPIDGKIERIRCEIQDAEYTPDTLCAALNNEIISKLPAEFNPRKCMFL